MIAITNSYTLKNGNTLIIRNAAESDAEQLIQFVNKTAGESDFLTFGKNEFEMTADAERIYIARCLTDSTLLFLVGTIENTIVSVLTFSTPSRGRTCHSGEFGLTVAKSHWSLGIGSHMLDTLINTAKETGHIRKINLQVHADNTPAILLYKKKGFAEEGRLTRALCINGIFYDNLFMGRCID